MNSQEIAKLANVSRSTVSRVINNYKNVPPETREKVQSVIDEYGYTPNISARTLAGKSNNIIGLFVADINETNSPNQFIGVHSPYNIELLSHVIESCKRRGYLTLIHTISDLSEYQEMEQHFANRMLYGGIFVGFPYRTSELEELARKGYNMVLIDQLTDEDDVNREFKLLNCDNVKGGYLATKYLIDRGHREIAHIAGDGRLSSIERRFGYEQALKEASIVFEDRLVCEGEYREDIAYEQTKKLLEKNQPTAMFVANDIMALGVMRAIEESELHSSSDIEIVGYDNLKSIEWQGLGLTSVGIDMQDFGESAVALLFQKEVGIHRVSEPILYKK